jgi:hypothetical protein
MHFTRKEKEKETKRKRKEVYILLLYIYYIILYILYIIVLLKNNSITKSISTRARARKSVRFFVHRKFTKNICKIVKIWAHVLYNIYKGIIERAQNRGVYFVHN